VKTIDTLIPDIYQMLGGTDGRPWFSGAVRSTLGEDILHGLQGTFGEGAAPRPTLRMSRLGPTCPRALWYSIHHPEKAEPLPPWVKIKFAYGHVLEALVLSLARAAGHEVTGEQDELRLDDIVGHRDCVIDGCVVDIKSASSRSFSKFKFKTLAQDDPFGYLDQLDGYVVASANDPLVRVKDKGYLLAIDKQLGHLVLYEHEVRHDHIRGRIKQYKEFVQSSTPPHCNCGVLPEGKAGNLRLDTRASYSAYKRCCFPHLRTFAYSSGPVDLVKVVREPDVPEIRYRTIDNFN